MDATYTALKAFGSVKTEVPLSKYTTFKIGGPAKYFLTVESVDALVEALQYLDGAGMPWFILGGGSNMLVRDDGFDGVVVQVKATTFEIDGEFLTADAGCPTVFIAQESMKAGLKGFEWGVGVPGTIGGAVRGNAGAMGKEMLDDVASVYVYANGEVVTYTNEACEFGYRHSRFKESGEVVLRVHLGLAAYDSDEQKLESRKQMLEFLKYRNETQPKGFASTGCIFKNPDAEQWKEQLLSTYDASDEKVQQFLHVGKISAGWLVQEAGMKGQTIGGAEVSPVHGNFIINTGTATGSDVLALIEKVKTAVYTSSGIQLEEEIQII